MGLQTTPIMLTPCSYAPTTGTWDFRFGAASCDMVGWNVLQSIKAALAPVAKQATANAAAVKAAADTATVAKTLAEKALANSVGPRAWHAPLSHFILRHVPYSTTVVVRVKYALGSWTMGNHL